MYLCNRKTEIITIGLWCNGNTTDSGPVIPGSNPGIPTTLRHPFQDVFFRFLRFVSALFAWCFATVLMVCSHVLSVRRSFPVLILSEVRYAKGHLSRRKTRPFVMQNVTFRNVIDGLLEHTRFYFFYTMRQNRK